MKRVQKVSVVGIGGFAAEHHRALLRLEEEGDIRVLSSCDPSLYRLAGLCEELAFTSREINAYESFEKMLDASRCDWISIATPIMLHAPMHLVCIDRGLACYLEKPPTLDPVELERMIAADSRAKCPTQVGFSFTYQPERLSLKKRLLAGEFGTLRAISLQAARRRVQDYFTRSSWSGRLMLDDSLILDSCLGNAISHHVSSFFLAGLEFSAWADCSWIEAVLLRANLIQGADTVFVRGQLNDQVDLRIAMTHACDALDHTEETYVCDEATIRIRPAEGIFIQRRHAPDERILFSPRRNLDDNLRKFNVRVSESSPQILGDLKDSRSFVALNALAYLSAECIRTVPAQMIEEASTQDGRRYRRIQGIEALVQRFAEDGDFAPLARISPALAMPIRARPADLPRLRKVISALCV